MTFITVTQEKTKLPGKVLFILQQIDVKASEVSNLINTDRLFKSLIEILSENLEDKAPLDFKS